MKSNQKGFGIIEVFSILLIVLAIGSLGWLILKHNSKNSTVTAPSSKTVLGYKLPLTSCDKLKATIQGQLGIFDGDLCYKTTIKTTGETFQYVIVDQSEAYKEKLQHEDEKNCTLDCGGSIPLTGPSDYIIRSNGRAETTDAYWTGSASIALEALTGCPLPNIDSYQNSGKFVVSNGRIGIYFSGNNIDLGGRLGNSCKASFNLVAYTSPEKPAINFQNLSVQYNLKDPSSCASKDLNDSGANSDAEQCYSDEAGMRGDIAICYKTYFSGTGTDSSECIHAVAQRNRDPSICRMTYKNDQQQCVDLANTARSYFNGTIKTTGL